jgi:hypothetical protein
MASSSSSRRDAFVDVAGLLALLALLVDCVPPALLALPTIAAGGDTPCHYPTAAFLREALLPHGRLHGWYAGAYLGQPLLLYYFPLPFALMAALAPLTGLPVAFKLVMAAGSLLLPFAAWAALRLMGFRFPTPLMGACGATVFLLVSDNPIWGGTLASTLSGEFSYAWGTALALVFLGGAYRAYSRGQGPIVPALLLALTALAHGYAVVWAGFAAAFFLYRSRRPGRTLAWLGAVGGLAFALAGVLLVPLLADWGWTTAYDDPWISVRAGNVFPPLLLPLVVLAVFGLGFTLLEGRVKGGADQRLLFLLHAALVAAVLALAAPGFGVIDVRLVPFAQLAVALAGAASLGLLFGRLRAARSAALGMVLLSVAYADGGSATVRAWSDWDFSGLEAKELWPAFRALGDALRGGVGDPRVAVEYSREFESGGTIRLYELLPFLAGRSTLEGVYNQAGLSTHAVYYVASELSPSAPNPFRKREYASFDPGAALARLRLFNVREIVALSPQLTAALDARDDVERAAHVPPFTVFRLRDAGAGYVEPLAFAPVRSSPAGWRDKAYRWLRRRPPSRALLVFSDDERFQVAERDAWLLPPEVPLPGAADVRVESRLEAESLTLRTNRPGHPLLVKVSYHPRWRAEGADGPYLVSPSLMMVIPRQETVRMWYAARTWADDLGLGLTLVSLAYVVVVALATLRRRVRGEAPARPRPKPFRPKRVGPDGLPLPTRRWGSAVPLAVALLLLGARCVPRGPSRADEARELTARARTAFRAQRYADAAEYARHALARTTDEAARGALSALRERSLELAARGEPAAPSERESGEAAAVSASPAPEDAPAAPPR